MQGLWVWRDNAYSTGIGFNISATGKEHPWNRNTNRESWQVMSPGFFSQSPELCNWHRTRPAKWRRGTYRTRLKWATEAQFWTNRHPRCLHMLHQKLNEGRYCSRSSAGVLTEMMCKAMTIRCCGSKIWAQDYLMIWSWWVYTCMQLCAGNVTTSN